jgi:hypothetical protein
MERSPVHYVLNAKAQRAENSKSGHHDGIHLEAGTFNVLGANTRNGMTVSAIGCGLVCVIAMGSGFVIPMGTTIGGLLDLVAIASGMACIGLLDGE